MDETANKPRAYESTLHLFGVHVSWLKLIREFGGEKKPIKNHQYISDSCIYVSLKVRQKCLCLSHRKKEKKRKK